MPSGRARRACTRSGFRGRQRGLTIARAQCAGFHTEAAGKSCGSGHPETPVRRGALASWTLLESLMAALPTICRRDLIRVRRPGTGRVTTRRAFGLKLPTQAALLSKRAAAKAGAQHIPDDLNAFFGEPQQAVAPATCLDVDNAPVEPVSSPTPGIADVAPSDARDTFINEDVLAPFQSANKLARTPAHSMQPREEAELPAPIQDDEDACIRELSLPSEERRVSMHSAACSPMEDSDAVTARAAQQAAERAAAEARVEAQEELEDERCAIRQEQEALEAAREAAEQRAEAAEEEAARLRAALESNEEPTLAEDCGGFDDEGHWGDVGAPEEVSAAAVDERPPPPPPTEESCQRNRPRTGGGKKRRNELERLSAIPIPPAELGNLAAGGGYSKRQRFRPLKYWEGERVVYGRRQSAKFAAIVDVLVAEP